MKNGALLTTLVTALQGLTSTVIDKDTNRISSPSLHRAIYKMQTKSNVRRLPLISRNIIRYEIYQHTHKMCKKYSSYV
jgi:transcription termination factor NusB